MQMRPVQGVLQYLLVKCIASIKITRERVPEKWLITGTKILTSSNYKNELEEENNCEKQKT